jgi:alpha/beta superfamily hydrolase
MNNHATYRLAKAVRTQGGASLRFNFRGVGRSAGAYDGGHGEVEDAKAGLEWLGERHPELPRLSCGFSFGSWMALAAGCPHAAVRGVLCAGLALGLREVAGPIARGCEKPVAVVQAERDEFGSPGDIGKALSGSAGARRLTVVNGATHLFTEDLPGLEREASAALGWLLGSAT